MSRRWSVAKNRNKIQKKRPEYCGFGPYLGGWSLNIILNEPKNRAKLNTTLIEQFSKSAHATPNHTLIARLPIHTVWTTNYGTLLGHAFASQENAPGRCRPPPSRKQDVAEAAGDGHANWGERRRGRACRQAPAGQRSALDFDRHRLKWLIACGLVPMG
jgi:hypothetical protein